MLEASQKKASDGLINQSLKTEAIKHSIVDLDALKLLDGDKIKGLQIIDGEVIGADVLISELKKSKPFLFDNRKASTSGNYNFTSPAVSEKRISALDMSDEDFEKAKQARGIKKL